MRSQENPRDVPTPRPSSFAAQNSSVPSGPSLPHSIVLSRALQFLAAVAVVLFGVADLYLPNAYFATALTPPDAFRNSAVAATAALLTIVFARRERRSPLDYGFRALHPLRNLIGGSLSGTALLSALILLLHHLDLLVFRGQVLYGVSLQARLALEWLALSALAALAAELLLHGYLQYSLTRVLSRTLQHRLSPQRSVTLAFWIAAIAGSLLFALLYRLTWSGGRGATLSLVNAVLFTLLMAFSLWRTGSLWWAWGFHLAWDWTESFLWGVPLAGVRAPDHLFYTESTGSALRSGGTAGPTASIYTVGALLAGFGILMLLHRARVYPELWEETAP